MEKKEAQKRAIEEKYDEEGELTHEKKPRYDEEGGKKHKEADAEKKHKCSYCGVMH